MKRTLLFLLILSLTLAAQDAERDDETPPVSIHLELGKDTLALTEPTMLTAKLTNLSGNDLVVDLTSTFGFPSAFALFLITPEGEVSRYRVGIFVSYASSTNIYFLLPPDEQATRATMIWWQNFVPLRYKAALEDLPAGDYKIYCTYRLPDDNLLIYSDTSEFVFLPLEEEHLPALTDMNYLKEPLSSSEITNTRLERIRDSDTPYSEGAWVKLLLRIYDYDSFKAEKSRFDKAYPNSQFAHYLLGTQKSTYLMWGHNTINTLSERIGTPEYDSLMILIRNVTPRAVNVLILDNEVEKLSEDERRMR